MFPKQAKQQPLNSLGFMEIRYSSERNSSLSPKFLQNEICKECEIKPDQLANVLGQIAKTISKWARCVFPKLVVSVRSLSNSPQELFMLHFLGGIMPRPVFVILAKSKHAYGVSCFCPCELHFIQLSFLLP